MTESRPRTKSSERIARRKEVRAARLEAARRRRRFPFWIVGLILIIMIAAGAAFFAVSSGVIVVPAPAGALPGLSAVTLWVRAGELIVETASPPGGGAWPAFWL